MQTSFGQRLRISMHPCFRRLVIGCLSCIGITTALAPHAYGQQTWLGGGAANNPTSGGWVTNGVWMGGPVNGRAGSNTTLTFMSGKANYTSANNIPDAPEVPFNLNSITFSKGLGTSAITLSDTTGKAGAGLLFSPNGGANPATIAQNTTATVTIQNPIQIATNQTLTLQSTNGALTDANCTFTGGISDGPGGTGGINSTSGRFVIDSNSTYTGGTTISGGLLTFGSFNDTVPISLGTKAAPTGDIVVSGGVFNIVSGGGAPTANAVYADTMTIKNGAQTILGRTDALKGVGKYAGQFDTTGSATPGTTVYVDPGGTLKGVGYVNTKGKKVIAGGGTIKGVRVNGTLQPGDAPGFITVAGGVEFGPGSIFSPIVDGNVPTLNDPNNDPSTEYSMLNVTDSGTQLDYDANYLADGFTAAGPVLAPVIDYVPAPQDTLFLIVNNGTDGNASGQFYNSGDVSAGGFYDSNGNALTQGSDVWLPLFGDTADPCEFQVDYTANYAAGSTTGGYDFALIAVPEPSTVPLLAATAMIALRRRGQSKRDGSEKPSHAMPVDART